MNLKKSFDSPDKLMLYEYLSKLSAPQFKMFYCLLVHYWANYQCFISQQNFFNLWCELNQRCHESDESFPNQYDDYKEIRSFCMMYPYYFIDRLPITVIANLFAQHVDDHIDVLSNAARTLYESDIHAAYTYTNSALGLDESIENLVTETQDHIKYFS